MRIAFTHRSQVWALRKRLGFVYPLYSKTEARDLIGKSVVHVNPYGPPKSCMDINFSNY